MTPARALTRLACVLVHLEQGRLVAEAHPLLRAAVGAIRRATVDPRWLGWCATLETFLDGRPTTEDAIRVARAMFQHLPSDLRSGLRPDQELPS